jgi:hypothetical protein
MDALEIKGFLGPTLKENPSLRSVGDTAKSIGTTTAEAAGVSVDDTGKLRCPPGTQNQGEFTDIGMSNCGAAVEEAPEALAQKTAYRNNMLNFVATDMLYNFNAKVGIFRSNTRLGRAAQGAGSFLLPGDTSDLRRPVRSTVYEALTPGGGGGRGVPGGGRRGRNYTRCPVGFEFGGRFAAKDFSNCGRQLFEVPTSLDDLGGGRIGRAASIAGRIGAALTPGDGLDFEGVGTEGSIVRDIPGLASGSARAIQIQRNARIPRVGAENAKARDNAINLVTPYVRKNPDVPTKFMVRRDGYTMQPVVPSNILATVRRNPDMEDATFVVNAPDPKKMGDAEVPLLWKVNARGLVVGLPEGGSVELTRTRPATRGERRKLTAAWERASVAENLDYGERLRSIAEASGGLLEYNEKLNNPKKANDLVTFKDKNGVERTVRRWVYDAFLSEQAPGRGKRSAAGAIVDETQNSTSNDNQIADAEAAKDAVRSGTALDQIPSKFLPDVLSDATIGTKKKFGTNSTLITVGDRDYLRIKSDRRFGALAARTSADVQTELGLPSTTVKFVGEGPDRSMLVSTPNRALFSPGKTDKELDFDQELTLAVSDFVLDQRDRNPNSVIPVAEKGKVQALVMPDTNSALAGLSVDELEKRRRLVLGDFYTPDKKKSLNDRYEALSDPEKEKIKGTYEVILKKLRDFNWDDYIARLGLDGGLSEPEKKHLNIIKRLFSSRLERLGASLEAFLKSMQ